jgi:malonate decarboxylase beta subunit
MSTQVMQPQTTDGVPDVTIAELHAFLGRQSFLELDARRRARAILDEGTGRELCGPFDRLESPWLVPQGLVPQADDGLVVVKGLLAGEPCVVIAIEGAFQGGGIGEVSGAKAACALQLAAQDCRAGRPTSAVILLETGGVRLQEATLALNAVAEVLAAVIELRALRPVVGVAAGPLGSFGGMSIAAGLCTRMIMTHEGRLGLNGPEVIESEAGVAEFDSSDRALVWSVSGGKQRYTTGIVDALVLDDVPIVRRAVITAVAAGVPRRHRSEQIDVLADRMRHDDGAGTRWRDLRQHSRDRFILPDLGIPPAPSPGEGALAASELGSMQVRGAVS